MTIINFKNRSTTGFDEDALFTFAGGEQVLNFGRLTTTGDLAEGIFAAADDVTIRNFGRVETNGRGALGILVLGDDARIENYGSVTTRGGHLDFEFFSEGILAIGDRFHIANYGTVRVEGEFWATTASSSTMVAWTAFGIGRSRSRRRQLQGDQCRALDDPRSGCDGAACAG